MSKTSQLLKRTLASNASLVRERQWFVDYLYTLFNSLRFITTEGKNSGIVDLVEMEKICKEIGSVVNAYDRRNVTKTGAIQPPKSAKELGEMTDLNNMSAKYAADMNDVMPSMDEFMKKIISDMLKQQNPPDTEKKKSDNQDPTWGEWKFFNMPSKDMFASPDTPHDSGDDSDEGYGLFDFPPEKPKKDLDGDTE